MMTAVTAQQKPLKTSTLSGAPEGQDALALAGMARALMPDDRALVHVSLDAARMDTLAGLLAFFAPDVRVVEFPAWDCLPYDRVSPHPDIVAQRVHALTTMLGWQAEKERHPRIVLTTVNAAAQRVTPVSSLRVASFQAKPGDQLKMPDLQAFLSSGGYMRTETVREAGEYAIRGGIIDLFPPGYDDPVRIDLFGDEVETIRAFDPMTQRTLSKLDRFTLKPATEFFLDDQSVQRFRAGYRETFGVVRSDDPLYEAISQARRYNGMDHWLPLFFERLDTLFDYLPGCSVTLDQHAGEAWGERTAQIHDFYQARKTLEQATARKPGKSQDVSLSGTVYHPLPPESLYLSEAEWAARIDGALTFSPFAAPSEGMEDAGGRTGRDFADIRALPENDLFGEVRRHMARLQADGRKILIAAYSKGSLERLGGLLTQAGVPGLKECANWEECKKLQPGQAGLIVLALESGFTSSGLAVLTEQDILGDRLARRSRKKRRSDNFLTEVSSLEAGDLVVHLDHGVGRFLGLETLKAAGTLHDCLKLEYAGGDKLFVPVENMEVLSRFGSDEGTTQLDRLGGAGWQARKAKVKKDLMKIAQHLLSIAAERMLRRGEKLQIENGLYNEFAARFPYQETEDQDRAIGDVLGDLASDHPMDRLICGDVGFGKTEVALRAAYVAAMSGVQVAVAVPTTLLARQHYQNFSRRFAGTGLRVEQLSRFVNARDSEQVKKGLADGSVGIVVGTHALFAKDMKFSHLGLLIVDEEQHFGVKQKERLKELKADVHVLTLTATPIPRTLQMALAGVREMSLIATPPVDRLAVRTFILPFDPVVVREAILREHYRGGQTFYVCPRIRDMEEIQETLKELVPEVKIVAAHGQMPPSDLEDRMTAFYDGQYDVLLATNIIESGLDIPTANTLIVHRSDMFGLAQLYQIRGRVGRSKVRAYAYLTYPPAKILTPTAQRRLEVMETLDTLGSGFQLASHDMDIRGAGNLLGEEQSGHIREVGVELYQQMLEDAVAAARHGSGAQGPADDQWSPQINIGTSVLIPENFVEDLNVRMSLYRRLSDLKDDADIESFAAELIDRFGALPREVDNLLEIVRIKQLCRAAGVDRLEAGPKGAVIGFYKNSPPNPPKLLAWLQQRAGIVKLRPDQKLVAMRPWDRTEDRIRGAKSLMKELAGLSSAPEAAKN